MNEATLLLYIINLSLIGALPFIFFKQGRFNLMWCLTSAPYVLCAAFLVASYAGVLPPFSGYGTSWDRFGAVVSVPFSVTGIALIFLTLGTHRVPLALWHQKNDAPHHIVTYGPYSRIRHPFYASFLVTLLGAFLFVPQIGTLFTLVYAIVFLNYTAGKEEKRLKTSEFGAEYEEYMHRAGRFWPRMRSTSMGNYERSVR